MTEQLEILEALYPNNEADFAGREVTAELARLLRSSAENSLAAIKARAVHGIPPFVNDKIQAHWKSIAAGQLPFGMTVASGL